MVPFGESKCICSDSGSEFTSHAFQALLTKYKIRHETFPPHQDDTAESSWQTVIWAHVCCEKVGYRTSTRQLMWPTTRPWQQSQRSGRMRWMRRLKLRRSTTWSLTQLPAGRQAACAWTRMDQIRRVDVHAVRFSQSYVCSPPNKYTR